MEPGDHAVVRRVAALLVAESDAASDEAVAHAVATFRRANGDAEPLRAGVVIAGFQSPRSAVAAAMRLLGNERPTWRVGLHAESFLTTERGAAGAAIERATALARVARPGTLAVGEDALATIGRIRGADLERHETPAGTVHLLIPRESLSVTRRRLLVAGVMLFSASVLWMVARGRKAGDGRTHITLAVGAFRLSRTDPEHDWIGPALRGGLNTQLSELSGVKVYSQEFIDFLTTREHVAEIEIATRLGIDKMLAGSVLVEGDSVRVDARIVDVASGIVEGAYATVGSKASFLALENDVVLGVISELRVPLSSDDERRLASRRKADPEVFRRLLEAEGEADTGPPTAPGERERKPRSDLLSPSVAYADGRAAELTAVLERYRRATEAHDVDALAKMYVSFPPEQRVALERYFASARDLRMGVADVDVAIVGDEAVLSYTRIDDFVDVPTGRRQHVALRVTRTLRYVSGRWLFAPRR